MVTAVRFTVVLTSEGQAKEATIEISRNDDASNAEVTVSREGAVLLSFDAPVDQLIDAVDFFNQ